MAITYVLLSRTTKRFYTGSSREDDVSVRVKRHDGGFVKSTKNGRPWDVVLVEKFLTYTEARKRELFLKSGAGRKILAGRFGHLKMEEATWRGTQAAEGGRLLIS